LSAQNTSCESAKHQRYAGWAPEVVPLWLNVTMEIDASRNPDSQVKEACNFWDGVQYLRQIAFVRFS
jgi:hypothetical protein